VIGRTVTTTDFTAPGFAWKPLDQLRFTLEPDQLQNLEAFDLARHRRQHNEDITILPFTRNPFSIASVLRKLVEKHRVLTVPPSKESDEDDDDEVCHNQERVDDAEMLAPLMGPGDPPVIALEAETLEARMAAYPILAPIWMVEFEEPAKEEEEGGKVKRHTMVLRGDTEETGIGARPYWAFWQACTSASVRLGVARHWTRDITDCGDQSWLPQVRSRPRAMERNRADAVHRSSTRSASVHCSPLRWLSHSADRLYDRRQRQHRRRAHG